MEDNHKKEVVLQIYFKKIKKELYGFKFIATSLRSPHTKKDNSCAAMFMMSDV
jgi:hypothetical protein